MFEKQTFFAENYNTGAKRQRLHLILKITCLAAVGILLLFIAYASYLQSKYLSLGLFDKKIAAVEIIEYEKEPFRSGVKNGAIITDIGTLDLLMRELNSQKICPVPENPANTVLFITFEDNTKINAYYADGKIGLNYGSVWLNIFGAEIFGQ